MEFKATHVLTVRYWNGIPENIPVRKYGDSLYTANEWNAADAADWTVGKNGYLFFQGKVPVCAEYGLTLLAGPCKREDTKYTLRDLVWAYKNVVGKYPSERDIDSLPDTCNQEDFEIYIDSFRIEREVIDNEKNRREEEYQNQFRD